METVDITPYIGLYKESLPLNRIKPLRNQTYKIFRASKLDIRISNRKQTYKDPKAFNKMRHFLLANEWFYMIPLTTIKGTIVGFIVRGVTTSDYNTITRTFTDYKDQVPFMFGFDKHFIKYSKADTCYPIILCEGCKDCLTLKKLYPYVLANNTSSMGLNMQVLRNISDKFILAYDNDKAGQDGITKDKRTLRGQGAYVDNLTLPDGYKDCTDYLIDSKTGHINRNNILPLRNQILKKVKALMAIQ